MMINKQIINLSLALLLIGSFSASEVRAESCEDLVKTHLNMVSESESMIKNLSAMNAIDISSYNVTVLQKNISKRFNHLEVLLKRFDKESSDCKPSLLGEVIAVNDLVSLDKSALSDKKLRRMIISFTKYEKFGLKNFRDLYAKYTNYETLVEISKEIKNENLELPDGVSVSKKDYSTGSLEKLTDIGRNGATGLVSVLARTWGFISDKTKWRQGHLKDNLDIKTKLVNELKPLDLIFETRKFTLSNLTIPGHWGHVAVWLGTQAELQELGIWDQEFFKPFQKEVLAGKNIIEVRKSGFNFESLDNFINLDDIAVTRIKSITNNAQSIYTELFNQMDKKYDFTFNAHTEDKITCAELISFSYGDIHWPGLKSLGQIALRPDDMAFLSVMKNSPAEFVMYISSDKEGNIKENTLNDWKELFQKRMQTEELSYL